MPGEAGGQPSTPVALLLALQSDAKAEPLIWRHQLSPEFAESKGHRKRDSHRYDTENVELYTNLHNNVYTGTTNTIQQPLCEHREYVLALKPCCQLKRVKPFLFLYRKAIQASG